MEVLEGGQLVLEDGLTEATLILDKGKIAAIVPKGEALPSWASVAPVTDCTGMIIFPGFIDAHTHLQAYTGMDWTADSFETGTRAAACGGTTTIVDYATQDKGMTLREAYDAWSDRAKGVCTANYGFHMAMSECTPELLAEMDDMVDLGISSFKTYFAYDHLRLNDGETYEVLRKIAELGAVLCVHCENGDLVNLLQKETFEAGITGPEGHPLSRPAVCEAEAIAKLCYLAEAAGARINVVHLSSKLGLLATEDARRRGMKINVESCPQYMLLDDSHYLEPNFGGAKYVMSPPLRKAEDIAALREALVQGEIDTLATDHCSFNLHGQKDRGMGDFRKIPNGGPGIEHRPALIMTSFKDELTYLDFARLMSTNPAKVFGMYPQKGRLAEGADADICVWNPHDSWTIRAAEQQQNVDYTPYEGFECTGRAHLVYVGGTLVAKDGKATGVTPGTYVVRHTEK